MLQFREANRGIPALVFTTLGSDRRKVMILREKGCEIASNLGLNGQF